MLSIYPFRCIYLADLDALMHTGSNTPVIDNLITRFPELVFWVDQGLNNTHSRDTKNRSWVPVIGTESISSLSLNELHLQQSKTILSLDFSNNGFLGPDIFLENDDYWPDQVIIMNLANVGGDQGPNWERLEYFRKNWPNRQFIAAGGICCEGDIERLASLGFSGVLLASALHRGQISASFIKQYMSKDQN